ncbi:MAG: hypothetical protein E7604_11595 [Ruminococcaceae bacterium]|nr:hypothetical protein [Oscillospiraceae bacterium]
MDYKKLMTVLLLAAALVLTACNKTTDDTNPPTDSDSGADTPVITETEPPAPSIPVIPDTETEAPQTTEVLPETEPLPETTTPIPALPPEIPVEETEPAVTETEAAQTEEPTPPTPVVIAKPTVDISAQLIPGGEPVTGQIASAQSEHIRLLLDYTVQQAEDGSVTLTLDVGLSCYELWCSAKTDQGTITVNGVSRTFSTEAIDHMVHEKTYIPFLTQTYNGTGSQSAAVEVSWNFNGTYGGTDVGVLTAGITLRYGADGTAAPMSPETEAAPETEPAAETTVPDKPVPSPTESTPIESTPTESIPVESAEPPVTEPVQPNEPNVPAETAESTVPEVTTEPGQPGADTTPAPEAPPAEPEAPAEPTVTGTPEETVPTDGQNAP